MRSCYLQQNRWSWRTLCKWNKLGKEEQTSHALTYLWKIKLVDLTTEKWLLKTVECAGGRVRDSLIGREKGKSDPAVHMHGNTSLNILIMYN
jgi:hypothetical protein